MVYDGEDLEAVATAIGRSREEVVRLHSAGEYEVAMLGFLPGFAYMRGLAPELCLPRRAPRPRVPAHSVAIGAEYTGIYPVASAGGWHLLGRALDTPRMELGDRVRFEPVDATADAASACVPAAKSAAPACAPTAADTAAARATTAVGAPSGPHVVPHLVITRLAGLALFVDEGRPGQMHRGMPPGGPLVRAAFERANTLVGGACAIELTGSMEVEARGGAVAIGTTVRIVLHEGERCVVASGAARVAYLAVEGGIDAPIVEGSRGALLAAGIGRPLKRGDVLTHAQPVQTIATTRAEPVARHDSPNSAEQRIQLLGGPDLDETMRVAIEGGTFTISPSSDRAGTRLTSNDLHATTAASMTTASMTAASMTAASATAGGAAAPSSAGAGRRASTPMVEGAIELTPSGLVVLGPDHPTTGGYPVVAILATATRDAFFAHPLGAAIRFRFVD